MVSSRAAPDYRAIRFEMAMGVHEDEREPVHSWLARQVILWIRKNGREPAELYVSAKVKTALDMETCLMGPDRVPPMDVVDGGESLTWRFYRIPMRRCADGCVGVRG